MRWLFGLFLIAHGLVHAAIWLAPATQEAPFDVRRTRLFGDIGAFGTALGLLAGTAFVMAGSAYLTAVAWWPGVLALAAGFSVAVLLVTFTKWWLLALAIDVAVGAVAVRELVGS